MGPPRRSACPWGRHLAGAAQLLTHLLEDRLGLDHVGLHAAGRRHDLPDASYALVVEAEVDDEVDGGRYGRDDEPCADVLPR